MVLSAQPSFAESIRVGVNPEQFRVVHRLTFEEAEPMIAHGLIDACVLDLDLTGIQGVWLMEKIRRRDARCPVIICTDARQPEWEEEAYLQGVAHVLTKPVRPRMFSALLERLLVTPSPVAPWRDRSGPGSSQSASRARPAGT